MTTFTKVVTVMMAVLIGGACFAPDAIAAMLTAQPVGQQAAAEQLALERKLVAEQLALFGLNNTQIQQRLTLLTEEEVHRLAQEKLAIGTGADLTGDQEQWLLWGGVALGVTATILSIIALADDDK